MTNKPYRPNTSSNVYYFIVRPITNYIIEGTSGGTIDAERGAWSQQVAVASGRYDTYEPAITDGNKTQDIDTDPVGASAPIWVGALVHTDGTVSSSAVSGKTVQAIICYVNDGSDKGNAITEKDEGYGHGLAISINGMMDGKWADTSHWRVNLPDILFPDVGYGVSISSRNDFQGIAKNRYIYENQSSAVGSSNFLVSWNYPFTAYKVAGNYTRSRWFVPSAGQMIAAFENLGVTFSDYDFDPGTINTTYSSSWIPGFWAFNRDYWTASECNETTIFTICFNGNYITDTPKDVGGDIEYRPVFAF